MDVVKYIMVNTGRRGSGKRIMKEMPIVEKCDVDNIDEEINGAENGAPVLYLFFKKNKFELAEVSADDCTIHLEASNVVGALISYLAVYYVFHVGYATEHESFLLFLQYAFLGEKSAKMNVATTKLINKFDEVLSTVKESKAFKKFCVN